MKKKILIATLLLSCTLMACGESSTTPSVENSSTETAEESTKDSSNDSTEEVAESTSVEETETAPVETTVNDSATLEEQVLLDQNGIKITATGISEGMMGTDINVLIENNSSADVTIQTRKTSVNGYMMEPTFSPDVTSGKKSNDTISFMSSDLENCGIEEIADISLSFHVFDSSSWDTVFDSEIINVQTSIAESYTQNYDDSGEVLYENNGIKIVSQGLSDYSFFGPSVKLYIENNTDQTITIQNRDTSVDGFMIDPTLSADIAPNKKSIDFMTFMSSDLEANNITDITSIETSFHIYLTDGFDTLADTEPINITF